MLSLSIKQVTSIVTFKTCITLFGTVSSDVNYNYNAVKTRLSVLCILSHRFQEIANTNMYSLTHYTMLYLIRKTNKIIKIFGVLFSQRRLTGYKLKCAQKITHYHRVDIKILMLYVTCRKRDILFVH